MTQWFRYLFDLFFPKACLGCYSVLLTGEEIICTSCRHQIPLTEFHVNPSNEIVQQFAGIIPIQHVSSLFYFQKNHFTQELIHNLKYRGHQEIGSFFGNWYAENLRLVDQLKTVDCIIPIPLHPKRFKERGYNQVETFGKALSEKLQISYNDTLLIRKINTTKQSKKKKSDREQNSENWFDLNNTIGFNEPHFLLIDDVVTTGATLEMATKKILEIPNSTVSIVTIAYAKK